MFDTNIRTNDMRIQQLDVLLRNMKQQLLWAADADEKQKGTEKHRALQLLASTASRVIAIIGPCE